MATKIQLRRDTAANWTRNNPVLAVGEPGLETDTGIVKYGDGSTAWNSLPYANLNSLADFTTSDLSEGSNLYYTNARVNAYVTATNTRFNLNNAIVLASYTYDNLPAGVTGAIVFETSNNIFRGYNGTSWVALS